MSKHDDYIYVTGDEPFIQTQPTTGRSALTKFATSAALVATGMGLGFAFSPASALLQQPVAIDAGSQNNSTLTPAVSSSANPAANPLGVNPASITNYQLPTQQLSGGTTQPDFGNLSSATPIGSGSWSNDDDRHENDSDDREDHHNPGDHEDDD